MEPDGARVISVAASGTSASTSKVALTCALTKPGAQPCRFAGLLRCRVGRLIMLHRSCLVDLACQTHNCTNTGCFSRS